MSDEPVPGDEFDFTDPATVISATTILETAAHLDGCDPLEVVDAVMDGDPAWWDLVDPTMVAQLDRLALGLVDHPVIGSTLVRAGYRMGRLLLSDPPRVKPAPDMTPLADTLLDIEGGALLDLLPPEATPLTLWLAEELVRRHGWWSGPEGDHELEVDDLPEGLSDLRTAAMISADLGWCIALVEHDIVFDRSAG